MSCARILVSISGCSSLYLVSCFSVFFFFVHILCALPLHDWRGTSVVVAGVRSPCARPRAGVAVSLYQKGQERVPCSTSALPLSRTKSFTITCVVRRSFFLSFLITLKLLLCATCQLAGGGASIRPCSWTSALYPLLSCVRICVQGFFEDLSHPPPLARHPLLVLVSPLRAYCTPTTCCFDVSLCCFLYRLCAPLPHPAC